MKELGALAAHYQCHVQSHISESSDEVEFSRHLDATEDGGGGRSDAVIFDSHQLLSDRCIMAHGVHLSTHDLDLLKARGAAVAHCPLSNFYFAGKTLPCRYLMEQSNKVGLGTDVAGGYSPSMMNSQRMAVVASHALDHEQKQRRHTSEGQREEQSLSSPVLDYRHAFYLATLGGAEALGLEHRIGTFGIGMEFDAIILSAAVSSPVHVFEMDSVEDVFQKLCTLGDDRNVKRMFVQGKEVERQLLK
jgi:guanine deaminase